MSDCTFGRKKATASNFSNPSLVSPTTPTLANPVRGFGLPTNNIIQTATDVSTQQQQVHSEQQNINEKPITHDISRISFHRPQAKLTVGKPGDKYEQEADMMAHRVMSMPDTAVQRQMSPLAQREAISEEEKEIQTKPVNTSIQREISQEEKELQTKPALQRSRNGNLEAGDSIESQLNSSKGGGSPLADNVRSFMEPRFGADFSQVRVHTDSTAVQMNRELGAQAFTHGRDIYYGTGKAPGNNELTAHELTHVVQQTGGIRLQPQAGKAKKGKAAVLEEVKKYDEYIQQASQQYGISVEQIRSIIAVESQGKPEASSGAAWGLMQLTKGTWKATQKARAELKDYDFATYWKDPRVNILFGTAALKAKMGNIGVKSDNPNFTKLAVVAYNAGEGTVKKAIALAKQNGSENPENDCLEPEYLKPAIKSTKIYSYYLIGQGYKRNPHIKEITTDPNHQKQKVPVPKEGSTIEQAEAAAIDLKYQEVSRYPQNANSYMELQSSSNNASEANSSNNSSTGANTTANTTPIGTATVTSANLNVRKEPSASASKLGLLHKGEQVEVIGKTGEWLNILYQGQPAFIHSNYTNFATKSVAQDNSNKDTQSQTNQVEFHQSDPRGHMTKLHPNLQTKVEALIQNAHKKGLDVWIIQGMRTIEQQNELYAQGRTKGEKGKTVTNAKGGDSYHNYGLAVDVVFYGSQPYGEKHNWKALGEAGKEAGLEWGGDWKSFRDRPHFQMPGLSISQLKRWYGSGGMENVWKNVSAQ